jgi:HAD superfamily hydrolase (TIGR01509 family)
MTQRTRTESTIPATFPSPVAAVLFDFDETMIDLERQHTAAYAALCRELGSDYETMPEDFRRGSGRRVIDDLRHLRAFFGWQQDEGEIFARRHEHFRAACDQDDLELLPGVERVVRALHGCGIPLAVTSSAVADTIDQLLRRFGLRDCFALIVDGSEVSRPKPDPEAYLLTARKLGLDPKSCVVFEDSQIGVLAARQAGAFCIAVRNPHAQLVQDLSAADHLLRSFEEVELGWFAPGPATQH